MGRVIVSTTAADDLEFHVAPLAGHRTGATRYFFVALGVCYLLVAIAGFVPAYQRYFAGLRELHWAAHVHGAILCAWLVLFISQSSLAASRSLPLHRKLGIAGVVLAGIAWVSMLVASVRVRASALPAVDSFLWDVLLIELMLVVVVPIFMTWGLLVRRVPMLH